MTVDEMVEKFKSSNNWMVRFSNDGASYGDFQWQPIGEWTVAPDWDSSPICGGGLHGQGPGGWGYGKKGSRFEFCETKGKRVIIDGDKIKVEQARILAVDTEAWEIVLRICDGNFPGYADLSGYAHPLPGLTSIGGSADLSGYAHPLPGLTSIGGSAYLRGYAHPLPGLTSIGGYADLRGYAHPLPGLTSIGGYAYLRGYAHPLPKGTRIKSS